MTRPFVCSLLAALVSLGLLLPAASAATTIALRVRAAADVNGDVPVSAAVALPADLAALPAEEIAVTVTSANGISVPGQIVKSDGAAELWFVLPQAAAGQTQAWTASLSKGKSAEAKQFAFVDQPGEHLDLLFGGRPVTRYMYAFDTSSAERRAATWKVYHHVFDREGKEFITQGAGGTQFPHHRGIFLGGKVEAPAGRGDWWHGQTFLHQEHLELTAGPVLARSRARIHWATGGGETVLVEERTTTYYRQSGETMLLMDFHSKLAPPAGEASLGGDREHGGMQYRAHGDIDARQTRYLFPAENTNVRDERDLPWAAMYYVLKRGEGDAYSVLYMNHPQNPPQTEFSAYRDYGRFGSFFKASFTAEAPLTMTYRLWIAPGELPSRELAQQKWNAFSQPPKVEVAQ